MAQKVREETQLERAPLEWIAADLRPLARPLESLTADPRNARRHDETNLRAIQASLRAHGQRKPIVARAGVVLAGNGTLEAARAIGWTHLACVEYEGPEALARAFAVADNRSAELASWDDAALAEALAEADAAGLLDATAFSKSDADAIVAEARGGDEGEDPGPGELPAEGVSVPGEIYELGPHRLLCGDSTDADAVERLLGGERARLVATDPPYGIDYVGGLRPGLAAVLHKRQDGKTVRNDGDAEHSWEVARAALAAAYSLAEPGCVLYVAAPSGEALPRALRAFAESGFALKHTLAWVKDQFVFGRCDYHYRHETVIYGWRDDGPHYFVDDRTQDSVLEFSRPKRSEEHPTMKPVELYERLVANSSRPGDLVYDPFTGSGTTLIACAKQGRRFVGCELDPAYADVIRRRWTSFAKSAGVDPGSGALE